MPDQPVVNGVVPLSPVLRKVSSIPPVRIEPAVSKTSELSVKIKKSMEYHPEDCQPYIRAWDSSVAKGQKDVVVVSVVKVHHRGLADWNDVLVKDVNDQ